MVDTTIRNEYEDRPAHPKLETIKKLLAKADSLATMDTPEAENERQALLAKVLKLSAEYGIDVAMDAHGRPAADEMVLKEYDVFVGPEHSLLLYRIAEALRCKALLLGPGGSKGVEVIGYMADIERAELLYTSLSLQMVSGLVREMPGASLNPRRSWMMGFIDVVKGRLEAAESLARREANAATPSGTGTDLVLAPREVAVKAAFDREHPNVKAGRRVRVDPGAYSGGAAAGHRANLHGAAFSGQRTAVR